MKDILNTNEIKELLTVWFANKDDNGWITRWDIKDNFSGKKTTEKEKRIFNHIKSNWQHFAINSYGRYKFRPREYKRYKRIGDEKMKRKYTCKRCGKDGHQARTCNAVDEELSRLGKPFQFDEIKDVVSNLIKEEKTDKATKCTAAINDKNEWDVTYINEKEVNHPSHYNPGDIEVIDAIEDWGLDFNAGNVIKYIVRSCSSGDNKHDKRQDLEKAIWYINRILNNE